MKHIAIFGFGRSGQSAFSLLTRLGCSPVIIDKAPPSTLSYPFLHEETADLSPFDTVILSPGIPLSHPRLQHVPKENILSEIELVFRLFPEKTYIGITGTNGKTTVTNMLTHALNASGTPSIACGNIGLPLSSVVEHHTCFVVELSSFQLETTTTQALKGAILLRITQDHLDRYSSIKEYAEAKTKILDLLQPKETAKLSHSANQKWLQQTAQHPPQFFHPKKGYDNEEAVLAFLELLGHPRCRTEKALATFIQSPHRLEHLGTVEGVSYINDSKATNIDSVVYALKKLKGPLILLMGGRHKGDALHRLYPHLKQKVRHILLFGEAAPYLHEKLSDKTSLLVTKTLQEAFIEAQRLALPQDTLLLSPGCSSLDQFKHYEERGNLFRDLVRACVFFASTK